ncbi:hypothetical protein [Mycolicibacter minnesotensis]
MLYLFLVLTLATLFYVGMRAARSRPKTRVIGPDDDPEFLWRIGRGDGQP